MDSIVKPTLNSIRKGINSPFTSKEPWQIVTITTTTVLACVWFYNILFQNECEFMCNILKMIFQANML